MPYDTLIGFTLLRSLQEHNNHHVSDNTTVRTLWNITVFCKLTPVTALKTFLAFPKLSWWEDGITARAAFIHSRAAFNSIDTVWVKKLRSKSWSAQWAPDKKIPNQAKTAVKRLRMCERCRGGLELAFRLLNTKLSHTRKPITFFNFSFNSLFFDNAKKKMIN